jgi:hypothetical protein
VLGSSRIPVRFHLWVSLAVAALAAIGADRLCRPGPLRVNWPFGVILGLVILSLPILHRVYEPLWTKPGAWPLAYHQDRYRWLTRELVIGVGRSFTLAMIGAGLILSAARREGARPRLVAFLPLVIAAELLGAHWRDVPTIDPSYWTDPPESARLIQADPARQRVSGYNRFSAGEPGYASFSIDFSKARDTLAWSLAPTFGLDSVMGATPMIPRRWKDFFDSTRPESLSNDLTGVSHVLVGVPSRIPGWPDPVQAGTAYVFTNPAPSPRVRLAGLPFYVRDREEAMATLTALGAEAMNRLIIEDPDQPLAASASASGTARIVSEEPDHLVITTRSTAPAYLVLMDTFDPGWSATVDGRPAPIRPAYVNFRGVYLPAGDHEVAFRYVTAGLHAGLALTVAAVVCLLGTFLLRRAGSPLRPEHDPLRWPPGWPWALLVGCLLIVLGSAFTTGPNGLVVHPRWDIATHKFTWGAGLEAMERAPMVEGR